MNTKTSNGLVLFIVGLIVGLMTVVNIVSSHSSKNWKPTTGNFKKGCQAYKGYAFSWERYYAYDYQVDGEKLSGSFRSISFPQEIINRFSGMQKGQELTVYYAPREISKSTLVPGYLDKRGTLFSILLAVTGIIVGSYVSSTGK